MSTGHTPGPWYETKSGQQVLIIAEMSGDNVAVIYDSQDAHLIAEAGTVASECGLSPRELLEQRDAMLTLLKRVWTGVMLPLDIAQEAQAIIAKVEGKTK